MSNEWFATIGGKLDVDNVHKTVIKPYITKLLTNIDKRFGDAVGEVSVASQLFCPATAVAMNKERTNTLLHWRAISS